MKILCVIDNLGSGGAQRQLVNIAIGLKSRGHEVEFFTYFEDNFFKHLLDTTCIPVHSCIKTSRFSIKPALFLRRIIRNNSFDAVLAFLETPAVYAELSSIGMQNIRLVVSERNISPSGTITIPKTFKALLHSFADAITTNSHTQRVWITKSFPWLREKVSTIFNGVDLDTFKPCSDPQFTPDSRTLKLLGLGRVTPQKNIPRLIAAMAIAVKNQDLDISIDWAGRHEDPTEFCAAKDALARHSLEDRWRWLGEVSNVAGLMAHYDALILPSLWEGLPNAVCEALASGLPVLASDISDNSLMVQDGHTGYLFDPHKVDTIGRVIKRFYALSRAERHDMGNAARIYAERELSYKRLISEYEEILLAKRYGRQGNPQIAGHS